MSKKKAPAAADRRKSTSPDYLYWSSLSTLHPFEAAALSFDSDPADFGAETGRSMDEALQYPDFRDRLRAIDRRIGNAEGIAPAALVTWMDESALEVPEGLRTALAGRGSTAAKRNVEELEAELIAAREALEQSKRELEALKGSENVRRQHSLDRLLLGLAIVAYRWTPEKGSRHGFAEEFARELETISTHADNYSDSKRAWRQKLKIDADTVRNHLQDALKRLES
jgi:hypothetical protein